MSNQNRSSNPTLQQLRKVAGSILGGSVKQCGCAIVPSRDTVHVIQNEQGVHFRGLIQCGNVWTCPVCQFKILQRKKVQLERILNNAAQDGCQVGFMTLTMPHHAFQSAKELREIVVGTYRKIKQSRKYRRMVGKIQDEHFGNNVQLSIKIKGRKRQLPKVLLTDFVGDVRTLEVTHGSSGWHPHLHVLLVAKCTPEQMETFASEIFGIWKAKIAKQGYGNCSKEAFRYKPVDHLGGVSDYVAKWDIYREMTDTNQKAAKGKGRNPSQILADIFNSPEPSKKDMALYREYSKAFKKRSKITFNGELTAKYLSLDEQVLADTESAQAALNALRNEQNVIQDKSDEEIVSEMQAGVIIGEIERAIWSIILKMDIRLVIRDYFLAGGAKAAHAALAALGVPCILLGQTICAPKDSSSSKNSQSVIIPPPSGSDGTPREGFDTLSIHS